MPATDPAAGDHPVIGVCTSWVDPDSPRIWSGVPSSILAALRTSGASITKWDLTPWRTPHRVIHKLGRLAGRADRDWTSWPAMRTLTAVTHAARRSRPPRADGWLHLSGGTGKVLDQPYVTFTEITPALVPSDPDLRRAFTIPQTDDAFRWWGRLQVEAHAGAVACCVSSRWAADSLVRDHGIPAERVHVVGYGPQRRIPVPEHRDWSTPRFLFIGRNWARKRGDAVVEAFTRVRSEIPDATLDVVGGHPPLDGHRGVRGHGLVDGWSDDGRQLLADLFQAATCFVLPSVIEPFGLSHLEAAVAGIPNIGTTNGGVCDPIGPAGRLVEPDDPEGLYRAMRELADPALAESLGRKAEAHATNFGWDKMAAGLRHAMGLD